jgi:hypothetical protein
MIQAKEEPEHSAARELLAFNDQLLERHKRLRCFRFFTDGTLEDAAKREIFLACLQALARHFQETLFMRQAHCAAEPYRGLFMRHFREEVGHDDVLRADRGRSDEMWDPIIEGVGAWFTSRMSVLDNIEKTAIVHLVLESSGAYMGSLSRKTMPRFGSANYFALHDELDDSHVTLALAPLRQQSLETLTRLRTLVEQAWRMIDTWADRVASLVLGTTAEPR